MKSCSARATGAATAGEPRATSRFPFRDCSATRRARWARSSWRACSIIAVEDDAKWGAFQRTKLVRERIANVEIVIGNDREGYLRPPAVATQMERGGFDFIMIDGRYRDGCAEAAVGMIKPGGAIYLDNSDVTQFNNLDGNLENARQTLQSAALERGGSVEAFVDFAPGLLFATSGHLYRF